MKNHFKSQPLVFRTLVPPIENIRLIIRIVFPSHKTMMPIILLFEKYIGNPVRYMNVRLGSVKPSWHLLCGQIEHLNSAPFA
jgi:hypothetical protein